MCELQKCLEFVLSDHGPGIDIFTPGKPGDYDLEGGIWEDEDARNFYENMVDLKAFVPAILFKDNEKSSQSKDKEETRGNVKIFSHREKSASFILIFMLFESCSDGKEAKDSGSTTEELELELETLDIADDPIELEGPDEAENEELAKKLLDEQGKISHTTLCTCS